MPAIWNVSNQYNVNNKKVSSKLTFEVGEKFTGRVIGNEKGNEVLVKLSDGWQFAAEIEGDYPQDGGLVRFEVEGFKEGKLKLKIINQREEGKGTPSDSLSDVIKKEGLSKEDAILLRMMVKHNIPLTKDNVIFIKSLTQFNEKINSNPEEVNKFIEKFLAGKGIPPSSEQGQNIKNMLTEFFKSFKTLNSDDILLFLENDIDINKENIDSYNKLFKGDVSIKEFFDKIDNQIKELDIHVPKDNNEEGKKLNLKGQEEAKQNSSDNNLIKNSNIATKVYDANDSSKEKVSMLSLLKSMVGNESELSKDSLKDILNVRKGDFTTNEYSKAFNGVNSITDEKLMELVKLNIISAIGDGDGEFSTLLSKLINSDSNLLKESINKAVSELLGKDVKLSNEEVNKLKDILNLKSSNNMENKSNVSDEKQINLNHKTFEANIKNVEVKSELLKEEFKNSELSKSGKENFMSSKDIVKADIKLKLDEMKNVIKELISHSELKGQGAEKVIEMLKGHMSDFKLLNSINNEYYYVDVPVSRDQTEYPCKLIIKDNRKDGKKIDKSNVKMVVSVKTINLGMVDGYLSIKNNKIDVDLKCDENVVKTIDLGKEKLIRGLQSLGLIVNVIVSKRTQDVGLTSCREFFNDNNTRAIDTKV